MVTPVRSFLARDLCAQNPLPCEADTTSCSSSAGQAECACLAAFVPSPYSTTSCKGETARLPQTALPLMQRLTRTVPEKLARFLCFSLQRVQVERGQLVPAVCSEYASLNCMLFMSLLQLSPEDLVDDFSKNVPF